MCTVISFVSRSLCLDCTAFFNLLKILLLGERYFRLYLLLCCFVDMDPRKTSDHRVEATGDQVKISTLTPILLV